MKNFPIYLFNHGSVLNYLSQAATSPLAKSQQIIVELATKPYLAHFAGLQTPANFPGIAASLNPQTSLRELAIKVPDGSHSLILAPGERLAESALADAWQGVIQEAEESLVGLLSVSEAAALLPLIELESSVTLFWDIDYPPTGDLAWSLALGAYLRERSTESAWRGIHFYSGSRAAAITEEAADFPASLREFSETIKRLNAAPQNLEPHATG